jgi:hypothetical protein
MIVCCFHSKEKWQHSARFFQKNIPIWAGLAMTSVDGKGFGKICPNLGGYFF